MLPCAITWVNLEDIKKVSQSEREKSSRIPFPKATKSVKLKLTETNKTVVVRGPGGGEVESCYSVKIVLVLQDAKVLETCHAT